MEVPISPMGPDAPPPLDPMLLMEVPISPMGPDAPPPILLPPIDPVAIILLPPIGPPPPIGPFPPMEPLPPIEPPAMDVPPMGPAPILPRPAMLDIFDNAPAAALLPISLDRVATAVKRSPWPPWGCCGVAATMFWVFWALVEPGKFLATSVSGFPPDPRPIPTPPRPSGSLEGS